MSDTPHEAEAMAGMSEPDKSNWARTLEQAREADEATGGDEVQWSQLPPFAGRAEADMRRKVLLNRARRMRIDLKTTVVQGNDGWVLYLLTTPADKERLAVNG